MSFLVFDIETRIDKALLRATQCRGESISDEEAFRALARGVSASESGGRSDFLPLSFHVPISIVLGGVGDDWFCATSTSSAPTSSARPE